MPSNFSITYPGKGRIKFDGGLNNKYEKQLIETNESPECQNVIFTEGGVETRGGTDKVNTAAVGTFAGEGLYTRHTNDGNQTMVGFWNGTMYTLVGTSFITVGSAQSVFTAGGRIGATEYENYLFVGNGNVDPYKYNEAFTRHGIPAPTATSTAASGGTGVISGSYQYKVTYVNSALAEGNPGPASATFVASANQIDITSIPVAPQSYGVNSRRIYRTEDGGTTFKRVTEISDNTTTTYTDNTADGSLGVAAPSDNFEPPQYGFCIAHQNRIFCNDPDNPNYVWYSDLAEPYTFGAANFVRIGDNTTDIVRGLAVYDNNVVVFCDNSVWIIYLTSTDDTEWVVVKARSSYGCKSPFGWFTYQNKLMFPAVQSNRFVGFAALEGDTVSPDATLLTISAAGSELKSNRIEPDMLTVADAQVRKVSSYVFENMAYITLAYGVSQTTNNRMYVFDFSIEDLAKKQSFSWVPWTGLLATQFTEYEGKLYYQAEAATGFVYEMNTDTYNDDGTAIDSYYWTKEFHGMDGQENWTKDFRYMNIFYENSGAYFIDVTYRVDSDKGDGNTITLDVNPGSSLWGTMAWGVDTWGGGNNETDERISLGQLTGKRIQFKFSNQNTVNQKFKIIGLNFLYNLKGNR